jgi:coproporphyrinogen III oxidase-like Fe-S oxidoreductase
MFVDKIGEWFLPWLVRREGRKFLLLKGEEELPLYPSSEIPLALYVHIPFCRKPCAYCSFNRYPFEEELASSYFEALKRELDMYLDRGFRFKSLYIGGGTPTVSMRHLTSFLEHLLSRNSLKEISLETNPNDVTWENIRILKQLGVKRLSMGVQSFQDHMLRLMGRFSHTGEEAREKVELLQGVFKTLNVDLLYNFPAQRFEDLQRDIEVVKELKVDQVTFYPLMPAPRRLKEIEEKVRKVDYKRERAFYELIIREMLTDKWRPSTAWCFSRGDHMIDEYIIEYPEYIAIGSGSVGLYKGLFFVNYFDLNNYLSALKKGKFPIAMIRKLKRREFLNYYLLTQLFGMKLKEDYHQKVFGRPLREDLKWEILFLSILGIIEKIPGGFRVTKKGMFTVSKMMREFFTALNKLREYCMVNRI